MVLVWLVSVFIVELVGGRRLYRETIGLGRETGRLRNSAQRMSDKAVRILTATDAGELLPRFTRTREHFECRFCSHAERCWGLSG